MIRAFLLWIISIPFFVHSDPSYTVTEGSSSALVAGAVNAITGDHYIAESDYQIQAAAPLVLPRVYISGFATNTHVGWQLFQHLYAAYYVDEDTEPYRHRMEIIEPNGSVLHFEKSVKKPKKKQPIVFNPINISQSNGLTNVGRGAASGQTNLKNVRVEMQADEKQFTIHGSDGTVRCYRKIKNPNQTMSKDRFIYVARGHYVLQWEKLPNQTKIFYGYDSYDRLDVVRTSNHNDTKTYAWASLKYASKNLEKTRDFNINTNDGRSLNYRFLQKKGHYLLANVETPAYPQESASYNQKITDGAVSRGYLMNIRRIKDGRHYKLDYYMPGHNKFSGRDIKLGWDDPRLYRVRTLSAPVGTDGNSLVTHRFFYYDRYTKVREIDDIATHYHYSPQQRLEKIHRYGKGDVIYDSERFVWGNEGALATNLLCHTIYEGLDTPILSKRYFYDDRGNVLEEKIYGQLSGQSNTRLSIGNDGYPQENGIESYSIRRSYSQDTYHLLLREEHPSGKTIVNSYLPNTSLLTSQLIYDQNQIKIRHFYDYNQDYILCKEITDGGATPDKNNLSGVKTRRIKYISLVPAGQPYQDMPQVIEEKYWDGQQEVLLKKAVLTYTTGGLVEKQDIYDASGAYCYSLTMKYDSAGRLKEETNALQQTARYDYDGVGNKILSQDFSGKKTTRMTYDFSNRLIGVEEIGSDGIKHITQHRYDTKHNRIATIDPYGNETRYVPDPFGNILETHLPAIPNNEGSLATPTSHHQYDSAGREISTSEANGDVTQKRYNIRNQVTHIVHPDQTVEQFVYNPDGTLHSHFNQKGAKTSYTYDFLGRMTSKTDALGQITTYVYDACNLISTTDAEGNVISYEYDGAGRKTAEQINQEKTEYSYDALGRLHIVKKGDLLQISEYNLLGQVTEERQEDIIGQLFTKINYTYDEAGNKSVITRFIDGKEAQELLFYDSFNRLIEYRDALGHVTMTVYDDHFKNPQGQTVIQKQETDPLGLQTITTYDVMGRVASLTKKNSETLTHEENFYDMSGNLVLHTKNNQSTTQWQYGPMNRLKALVEGRTKVTEFTYTETGQLRTKKKPGNTVLTSKYDLIDQMIEHTSSDGSIHYIYRYNRIGQQIEVLDSVNKTTSHRRYDACGRLLEEKLANGLTIASSYDERGRKKSLTLSDRSSISYTYDALHLKTISRHGLTHQFNSYDLAGNLLQQTLMGNLGKMTFSYDLLGRKVAYENYLSSQKIYYDPVGNVTWTASNKEKQNYEYDALYQLKAEKNHRYSYDRQGNRISKDNETYDCNQLHQVVSHLTYDPNGNPNLDQQAMYSYDALDRLVTLKTPLHHAIFSYDEKGRLLKQHVDGTEVLFLYDEGKEIGMTDSTGHLLQLRILNPLSPSERGAAVLLEIEGNQYYPQHDLFGNIQALLDLKGNLVESYEYSAFGEGIKAGLNSWQYASKRSFPELRVIHFGQRFYDPKLGRWLTPDPAGFIDGNANLYLFVENNPLSKFDLYGLNIMDFHHHYEHKTEVPSADESLSDDSNRIHPHAWEGTRELISNPQVQGAAQTVFGYLEVSAGVGLSCTPLAPLGIAMMVHATDHVVAGVKTMYSGQYQTTVTAQLLEKTGLPPQIAGFLDNALSAGASFKSLALQSDQMTVSTMQFVNITSQESFQGAVIIPQTSRLALTEESIAHGMIRPKPIWSSRKNVSSVQNAYNHWKDHGHEFSTLQNSKQYVEAARTFTQSPRFGTLTKVRSNGDIVFYDPSSNTFAVINKQGLPRSMFKPNPSIHNYPTNLEYFYGQ